MINPLTALLAFIRGGRQVWLEDYFGERYRSVATVDRAGRLRATIYPLTGIGGPVTLEPDGTIRDHYTERWKYCYPRKHEIVAARMLYGKSNPYAPK